MGAPGFDDAPFADVPSGDWKPLQFVYPYYENPLFFERQLNLWESYPWEVRAALRVNVVDDGSPEHPTETVLLPRMASLSFALRLFRIEVDVRWNWLAARNIGMHHAHDGWCVLTDMDHMVPPETAVALSRGRFDPAIIYRFSRRESTGVLIHPHPNSMFMTREMFWRVGGYDEALSGHYGTDGDWRRRCAATAPVRTLREELARYEFERDSSTQRYLRKQPEDAGKKAIIKARGPRWRPRALSFPYHEVAL